MVVRDVSGTELVVRVLLELFSMKHSGSRMIFKKFTTSIQYLIAKLVCNYYIILFILTILQTFFIQNTTINVMVFLFYLHKNVLSNQQRLKVIKFKQSNFTKRCFRKLFFFFEHDSPQRNKIFYYRHLVLKLKK